MVTDLPAFADLGVRSDFEGGNVEVLQVDTAAQRLRVRPALGPSDQRRIWFYFEVSGCAPGHELTVEVASREFPVAPDQRRVAWLHPELVIQESDGQFGTVLGEANSDRNFRIYRFRPHGDRVRVSLGYPYVYSDVMRLVANLAAHGGCVVDFPWKSEGARDIPRVRVGTDDPAKPWLLVIGRQHAFEVGGSFFLEGLLQAAVRSNTPAMRTLRERLQLAVVPMMDVDNVAAGATGRLQKPVDFNRSWTDPSQWKAVAGVQAWTETQQRNRRLLGFIDVHTPFPVEPLGHYFLPSSNSDRATLAGIYDEYRRRAGIQVVAVESSERGEAGKAADWFARLGTTPGATGGLLFSLVQEVCWHHEDGRHLYTPAELRELGAHYMEALAAALVSDA